MPTPSPEPRFPSHILCAVDAEGHARDAIPAAVWLSERLGAQLEFVHAFPPRPVLWGRSADMPEWVAGTESAGRVLRAALRESLRQAPAELGLRTSADTLRLHLSAGHPAQVILERARGSHCDLIVLGPHAQRGRLDFGNTARAVLAHAPRGVWVQPAPPKVVRRILAPLDLSPDSLRALDVACELARALEGSVTALKAFQAPVLGASFPAGEVAIPAYVDEHLRRAEEEEFQDAMQAYAWNGVPHAQRFEQGAPAERVLALQDEHDLIVMGTHGRTGLSAALLGNVTHAVLRTAHIPVLALRHARATYVL